ncbi:MAG TPA: hypothetical protein VFX96_02990 [Pyrinomonadaceae bacterium]|nr:hypothetical protein [Pyrinomonadaceae bacterium]
MKSKARAARLSTKLLAVTLLVGTLALSADVAAQDLKAETSAVLVRQLGERDAQTRREAAEELARRVAVEHQRLVEGYRMQEGDARVRLALDWALYRMGKSQALFEVVRGLESDSRYEQSLSYLAQLETPAPLHVFLKRLSGKTQSRLIEALARVGDASTLEELKPFIESSDPLVSEAAKFAEREINIRLEEQPASDEVQRQRRTNDTPEEEEPPV